MKLSKQIDIHAKLNAVYDAFRDLQVWLNILPDVVGVQMIYDDVCHQEFLMTVQRPAGHETIRGIRFCETDKRIDLCQFNPPPGFTTMRGTWHFCANGESTRVLVDREFELVNADEYEQKSVLLAKYLETNLQLFKKHIEMTHANSARNDYSGIA